MLSGEFFGLWAKKCSHKTYLLKIQESGFWLSLPSGNIIFTDGSIMLSRFAFVNWETLEDQERLHA